MMPWFRAMLYFLALCWLHTEMSNLAKSSDGQKIARVAPISKIFCRNRPRRPELNFEKNLRAVLLVVVVVCRRRCRRRRRRRRGRWHGGAVQIISVQ